MKAMRIVPGAVALALAGAGDVAAQQPAPESGRDVLNAAVLRHAADEAGERARLQSLLARPEVRAIAEAHALDIRRVKDAAGTLSGAQLQAIAPHLQAAENALAGGQAVTISTTTIIIILLVIILLVLIV